MSARIVKFALPSRATGFTLMEVIISMAIATVLMAALAGLFSQSVKTRQQVDRDGQKIENGRYALDVMTEDLRLAGYWGTYSPPNKWTSVDWKPVSPFDDCSTINLASGTLAADRAAKILATTTGWTSSLTTPFLPTPILGFEAHSGGLNASISRCLPNYLAGDVIVVRRASTATTAITALSASKTYLQASACDLDGSTSFVVAAGATGLTEAAPGSFVLRPLGCSATSTTRAPIRELMTRVYYVASENEAGDQVPTLKVLDLGDGSITPRTVATGVENLHIEYGLDNNTDGATDAYTLSSGNPLRLISMTPTTVGTALGGSWVSSGGEDQWEDVMALKIYVVVRDLEATTGYTNTSTFIMGQATATPAATSYKTKMSSTTVRVNNMSGRREQ